MSCRDHKINYALYQIYVQLVARCLEVCYVHFQDSIYNFRCVHALHYAQTLHCREFIFDYFLQIALQLGVSLVAESACEAHDRRFADPDLPAECARGHKRGLVVRFQHKFGYQLLPFAHAGILIPDPVHEIGIRHWLQRFLPIQIFFQFDTLLKFR